MDDQQRARELLAQEWRKLSEDAPADMLVAGCELPPLVAASIAAITAALRDAPVGLTEQHARDGKELRRLCQSRDFYKRRCVALQTVQSNMRDPERKAVCDILANGETAVYAAARPQGVKE